MIAYSLLCLQVCRKAFSEYVHLPPEDAVKAAAKEILGDRPHRIVFYLDENNRKTFHILDPDV
jgi:hypothetical protein